MPLRRRGWMALPIVLVLVQASAAFAQDGRWTFGAIATTSYRLDFVSSPEIFAGALGAANPTLNLALGKRYEVTAPFPAHPIAIIAKHSSASQDVVLLQQGPAPGSLESDPGIQFVDNGAGQITFTVTQTLVDAMNAAGRLPGYHCGNHPLTMRGNFAIVVPPVIPSLGPPAWIALTLLLVAAAWLATSAARRRA